MFGVDWNCAFLRFTETEARPARTTAAKGRKTLLLRLERNFQTVRPVYNGEIGINAK
jgi:hypothetical protein